MEWGWHGRKEQVQKASGVKGLRAGERKQQPWEGRLTAASKGTKLGMRASLSKILLGPTSSGEKSFLDSPKCARFESHSNPWVPLHLLPRPPAGPMLSSSTALRRWSSQVSTAPREVVTFPEAGILLFSGKKKKKKICYTCKAGTSIRSIRGERNRNRCTRYENL